MKQKIELEEHERQRCEVWTRVMGYHRPVSQFNAGKQSEHRERAFYAESVVTAPLVIRHDPVSRMGVR